MNYFVQFFGAKTDISVSWILYVGFNGDLQESIEQMLGDLKKRSGFEWVCRTVRPFTPVVSK